MVQPNNGSGRGRDDEEGRVRLERKHGGGGRNEYQVNDAVGQGGAQVRNALPCERDPASRHHPETVAPRVPPCSIWARAPAVSLRRLGRTPPRYSMLVASVGRQALSLWILTTPARESNTGLLGPRPTDYDADAVLSLTPAVALVHMHFSICCTAFVFFNFTITGWNMSATLSYVWGTLSRHGTCMDASQLYRLHLLSEVKRRREAYCTHSDGHWIGNQLLFNMVGVTSPTLTGSCAPKPGDW